MQPRTRPRPRKINPVTLVVTASMLVLTAPSAAIALPSEPGQSTSPGREFRSSFESDEAQPDWRNTVEVGTDGKKRSSGVDGSFSSGIPGNVTDKVIDLRASDENTGGGETKENLVDLLPSSKWLGFEPTAWIEFDTDGPVKVSTYALTSANDFASRDPRDWTLKGSADGENWTVLDSRSGETFAERFQTRTFDIGAPSEVTAYAHYRLEITKNNGASDATQLADVQFSDGDTSTPSPASAP
jgi:hypothetical protein